MLPLTPLIHSLEFLIPLFLCFYFKVPIIRHPKVTKFHCVKTCYMLTVPTKIMTICLANAIFFLEFFWLKIRAIFSFLHSYCRNQFMYWSDKASPHGMYPISSYTFLSSDSISSSSSGFFPIIVSLFLNSSHHFSFVNPVV